MQRKHLRFGQGFRIVPGTVRSQTEMVIEPGKSEGGQDNRHRGADQWLFVVEGEATPSVNGKSNALSPGSLILIERGDRHEIRNTGRELLRTLNIYLPPAYSDTRNELPCGRA